MPLKDGRRTDREALFIGHMAATGDPTYAAVKAGYKNPAMLGWQKAHNPAISAAVQKAQAARMTNELLPLSLDLLHDMLTDDKRADRVRLVAAQTVLKYTLGAQDSAQDKDPSEMTPAEIQQRIDALRKAAADKARPVIEGEAIEPKGDVFG